VNGIKSSGYTTIIGLQSTSCKKKAFLSCESEDDMKVGGFVIATIHIIIYRHIFNNISLI
jgi:hypothetical protein